MIAVPKTETGLTVSVREQRARDLIGDREAVRVEGPKSALVYEVGNVDIKFFPGGYTTVEGPESDVFDLIG